MKFQPKTEEQIRESQLIEPGEYDFEVLSAVDHISQSGNESIKLQVRVYVGETIRTIFDYLSAGMEYKLRHFCEAVGILHFYESGELLAIHCAQRAGKCKVGIQKDKTGAYPDKNVIQDYLVDEDSAVTTAPSIAPTKFTDDEIPF